MLPQKTIDNQADQIETMILLALHAQERNRVKTKRKERRGKWDAELLDASAFVPKKPEFPRRMIGVDMSSDGRLFSFDMDDLVTQPSRAIGRGIEVAVFSGNQTLKWTKIKPMPRPTGVVALTNSPALWFALHYREIKEGQPDIYVRKPLALANERPVPLKFLGWNLPPSRMESDTDNDTEALALALSIFEDAHRSGSILATITEAASLTFPVGADAYRSFFAMRDGLRDTPTGRRNPLLHWCSEHIRQAPRGPVSVVGHDRGKAEVVHGSLRLSLQRADGYAPLMEATE